ncbi:MAG: hypothetical protein WC760_09860 [Bacteroidia bacterium]|jgi:hypothetical protein
MKGYIFITLNLFCVFTHVQAQTTRREKDAIIQEIVEKLIESGEPDADYSDPGLQLESIADHKLDLNHSDEKQFSRLYFLSRTECQSLVRHRIIYGNFLSIYELQCVEGLSSTSLYYLIYFVEVKNIHSDQKGILPALKEGKHQLSLLHENEFETRNGYKQSPATSESGSYTGSPFRYAIRYRFTTANYLSLGYSGEKDMGESMHSGFDFQSAHVFYKPAQGRVTAWVVGDYLVGFGQGLTFGSGTGPGKSAYITQLSRTYPEIRPYRSLGEQDFLRGAAFTLKQGKASLTSFVSRNKLSSSLDDENAKVSSILTSGTNRTKNELEQRHNLTEFIAGMHFAFEHKRVQWGFTATVQEYDRNFEQKTEPYQLYRQTNQNLKKTGIDFQAQNWNLLSAGEITFASNGALSGLLWLLMPLDEKLDLALLYRNYDPGQDTRFVNAFSESGTAQNEQGFYTGVQYKVSRRFTVNAYIDMFRSVWLRYRVDAPSAGKEILCDGQYAFHKNTLLLLRIRNEQKMINQPLTQVSYIPVVPTQRTSVRVQIQYPLTKDITGKSRVECVWYRENFQAFIRGSMIFQEIKFHAPNKKISLTCRTTLFSADDYNARIYAMEQDVPGQFALALLQHSGIRNTLLLQFKFHKQAVCWIKYSHTQYHEIDKISSGSEEINGSRLRELRCQLMLSF